VEKDHPRAETEARMKLYERLPDHIDINNKRYRMDLDFRNVLHMLYILERDDLLPMARDYLALKCVMRHPPKDTAEAMRAVRLFLFGESSGGDGKRVTSFDQDADMIRAAFMQEYGINLYRDKLHWFEFTALLYNLQNGNKYTEVVGIRGRPIPPATKWNQQEREALIRAQAAYALQYTDEERKRSYSDSLY
jgi:hypothetical protein